jgi:hypothetical protein
MNNYELEKIVFTVNFRFECKAEFGLCTEAYSMSEIGQQLGIRVSHRADLTN